MGTCVAYRCTEPAGPDQLCPGHRRRLREGRGLPTALEKAAGDPSGHGTYGIIDRDDDHGILCHECGQRFASVTRHARATHDLPEAVYRAIHGLGTRATHGYLGMPRNWIALHNCPRCGVTHRSPRKRCDDCLASRAAPQARRPRWRTLTPAEAAILRAAEPDTLASLVPVLQSDRVTSREIGEAIGMSPHRMARWFPRLGRVRRGGGTR